jgi:hypothetical protein
MELKILLGSVRLSVGDEEMYRDKLLPQEKNIKNIYQSNFPPLSLPVG